MKTTRGLLLFTCLSGAVALAGWAGLGPANAQTGPDAPVAAPAAGGEAASPDAGSPKAVKVDETALRYFARQGDTTRLNAEIARLKALYPDWTPPSDPLAAQALPDAKLDAMWKLYSEGKYAEICQAITERQSADPQWQVPKDLTDRLVLAESRQRLVNASDIKQYETVISLAAGNGELLTCDDVDVLWRVAEAFAQTGRAARAGDAYRYILTNCADPQQRIATVQKASLLLDRGSMDGLLALSRKSQDGKDEFQSVRDDLVRKSVGAAAADTSLVASQADVLAMQGLARASGTAADANLLGWYYIGKKAYEDAADWFTTAYSAEQSADAAQGLALAMIALGRPAEAEDLVYKWRGESPNVRAVYLAAVANLLALSPQPQIETRILERMVPAVIEARDVPSAQQLGWYARNFNQTRTAAQWFRTALGWKSDDEPSAYGLVLTLQQLRDKAGVAEIQRLWKSRSQRIADLGEKQKREQAIPDPGIPAPTLDTSIRTANTVVDAAVGTPPDAAARQRLDALIDQTRTQSIRGTQVAQAGSTSPASRNSGCSTTDMTGNVRGQAALQRGWCLMELNRPVEAVKAFEAALGSLNGQGRSDAAFGQALAYLRSGLTDEAAVAAAKAPQSRERAIDLEAAILSQRATSFFEAGRYNEALLALDQRARIAADRTDLMVLRGYAYLKLGRKDDARRVFEAVAAAGDHEGIKGLAALNQENLPGGER